MRRTIVVSDLHVDTWTDRPIGHTGKSRLEHFFTFLDWCEHVQIRELVINGDLMDLPPYHGFLAFSGASAPIVKAVIERLIQFAARTPVTVIYGNHDIGMSGFRCMGADSILPLRNASFCYPNYVIDDYPTSTILIEHGHFYDPFLMLYVKDLTQRTYLGSHFDAFMWAMQRRDMKDPQTPLPLPDSLQPIVVAPGQNAYYAAKQGQRPLPPTSWWSTLIASIRQRVLRIVPPMTRELWWRAALEEMARYLLRQQDAEKSVKPTIYQIYGHTHCADPREPVCQRGVSCIYLNAGSWTEHLDQGWYVDIDAEGHAWLQDWINEPERLRCVQ